MINNINHYSIENTPTVYDEEALTALQLIARVTGKLNEVIRSYNSFKNLTEEQMDELRNLIGTGTGGGTSNPGTDAPDVPEYDPKPEDPEEPEVKNDYAIVYPSGDISGVDDLAAIQDYVSTKKIVILAPGEYYLAAPIIADAGVTISGCGITNTVVNCSEGFITHEVDNSIDHLSMRDIWVKGKGTGTGVNIARVNDESETGGRYSYFENVRISEFSTGVDMTACWCVQFNHCRFEACSFGVIQGHTCNNITYNHCQFLGTNDSTGLFVNSEGGAQSCGTHVVNCDFERHKIGVRGYCAVSLVIHNIYCESTTDVIKLDSCPGFLCDGGYISYPGNLVLSAQKTNELPFYENSSGVLKNIFVQYNSENDRYIMTASGAMPIRTENINAFNAGTGVVWVDSQYTYSKANGHENHDKIIVKSNYSGLTNASALNIDGVLSMCVNKQYKLIGAGCLFNSDYTPTNNELYAVYKGNDVIMHLELVANTTYKKGQIVPATYAITDYKTFICGSCLDCYPGQVSYATIYPGFNHFEGFIFEYAVGEMVAANRPDSCGKRYDGSIFNGLQTLVSSLPVTIPELIDEEEL